MSDSLFQLHISGMMTDLPVHTSTDLEVTGLISTLYHYLHQVSKRPALVTIARCVRGQRSEPISGSRISGCNFSACHFSFSRSAEDEYTPEDRVDHIQQQVLSTLCRLYDNSESCDRTGATGLLTMAVQDHYNSKPCVNYEPPGEICDCTYL